MPLFNLMKSRDGSHRPESRHQGEILEGRVFGLFVKLWWDHFDARDEQKGPDSQAIQNQTGGLSSEPGKLSITAAAAYPHIQSQAQEDPGRCQGRIKEYQEDSVETAEACLDDTDAEGKGFQPLVCVQADKVEDQIGFLILRGHPKSLQEAMDGECQDKDEGLRLAGG